MSQSLEQLNPMFEREYGIRLALRVGVATGEAVAATESVREFLVTGNVANLAARLQAAGEGVVVSQATYRLLQPLLEAEPTPALDLKGFAGPVTAYSHYWQALDLLARLPDTPAHRRTKVEVVTRLLDLPGWAKSQAEREKGFQLLAEAVRMAEALDDPSLVAHAEAIHGSATGDEASLRRATARARAASDRRAEAFALDRHSGHLGFSGQIRRGPLADRQEDRALWSTE